MSLVDFEVEEIGQQEYYGFEIKEPDKLYKMPNGIIYHNSGKSVAEQNIIAHCSKFSDKYQLVGIDLKQTEFGLIEGVKGVKGVALFYIQALEVANRFKVIMDKRFTMMKENSVNNVFKLPKDLIVDYYEVFGQSYQFDEIFTVTYDIDYDSIRSNAERNAYQEAFPDGRMNTVMTIEELYEKLQNDTIKNPQLYEVKGYNSYIDKNSIKKTSGPYRHKALILLVDEYNELTSQENNSNFSMRGSCNSAFASIARLGRAADVHLCLAMQNATVRGGMIVNIDLRLGLGSLSASVDGLIDGKKIAPSIVTKLSNPKIKGRAALISLDDAYACQTYYASPEDTWEFDTNMKITYKNKVFLEQCEKRDIIPDDSGFVRQHKVNEELKFNFLVK